MCGRYVITSPPEAVKALFGHVDRPNFPARHNIAPTQPVPIIRSGAGGREFVLVRWGLVPSWMKEFPTQRPLINARSETLFEKPSFKRAVLRRRCLFPANGYYEWQRAGKGAAKPYFIHQKNNDLFAMAGIWEHWQGADGSEIETAALITTQANETLASIHHRMPVILDLAAQKLWLDEPDVSAKEIQAELKSAPDDLFAAHPVSSRVNAVSNEGFDLVEPIEEEEAPEEKPDDQLSLF